MSKYFKILKVQFLENYKLSLEFNDGKTTLVDFEGFLVNSSHPEIKKYLKPSLFKKFEFAEGDLMWGDFDLVFPVLGLYENSISHKKTSSKGVV